MEQLDKLTEADEALVLELVEYRNSLKCELKHLTNSAIAKKFEVSSGCIDRIAIRAALSKGAK